MIKYGIVSDKSKNIKHGHTLNKKQTTMYSRWSSMKDRCLNERNYQYHRYGGRGITVCEGWLGANGFVAFCNDMGAPSAGETLDRIDNNLPYSCGHCQECASKNWGLNCRWANGLIQGNNKRNNVRVLVDGENLTVSEIARKYGLSEDLVRWRVRIGWVGDEILGRVKRENKHNKAVIKMTMNGEYISEYKSMTDAAKDNGVSIYLISKAALNIIPHAKGYKWKKKQ